MLFRSGPRDVERLAAEVFALPAKIAAARKKPMAIALDEFQTIASFDNGTAVEEALRAAVQHQRAVGYVFAGSEPRILPRSWPFIKSRYIGYCCAWFGMQMWRTL